MLLLNFLGAEGGWLFAMKGAAALVTTEIALWKIQVCSGRFVDLAGKFGE